MKKYIVLCLLVTQLISLFAKDDSIKNAKQLRRVKFHDSMAIVSRLNYEKILAQYKYQDSIQFDKQIKSADFIFEGFIKKASHYNNGKLMESYIVDIKKVFKGNLKEGTVEILFETHTFTEKDKRITIENNIADSLGIFLCREGKEYPFNPKYNIDKVDNKIILTGDVYSRHSGLEYIDLVHKHYKSEVYDLLREYPGLNVPAYVDPAPTYKTGPCPNCMKKKTPAYMDSLKREIKKRYEQQLEKKKLNNSSLKSAFATNNDDDYVYLTFTMKNFVTSALGSDVFMEFDVDMTPSDQVSLADAGAAIQFNKDIFNSDGVILSPGPDFPDSSLQYGVNDDEIDILLANVPVTSKTYILFHVIMPAYINTPDQSVIFNFIHTGDYDLNNLYYDEDGLTNFFNHYEQPDSQILCPTSSITNVTPFDGSSDLIAGRNQVIVITGKGFGKNRACGMVTFTNADGLTNSDGSTTMLSDADDFDYQVNANETEYWTDTVIHMLLPNVIIFADATIGTGPITLTTGWNATSDKTCVSITISQNYQQSTDDYGKKYVAFLCNKDAPHGIGFKLGPGILADPAADSAVQWAFKSWSCKLNISLAVNQDARNFIDFVPKLYSSGRTMQTSVIFNNLSDGKTAISSYPDTIKIIQYPIFVNGWPWDFSLPGRYTIDGDDFYSQILHEIGHVLLLDHLNDPKSLMYWVQSDVHYEIDRKTLDNCSGAVNDAKYIATASEGEGWLTKQPVQPECPVIPNSPVLTAKAISSNQIELNWTVNDTTITSFNIYNSGNPIITVYPPVKKYDIYNIFPGETYSYYVTAINSFASSNSNTVPISTMFAPSSTSGSSSSSGVTISWSQITGATGYIVEKSTSPNFTSVTTIPLDASKTTYTDANTAPGVTYYYKVVAINASGNSSPSSVITVTACLRNPAATANICGPFNSGYDNTTSPIEAVNLVSCTTATTVASGATLFVEASNSITFNPGFTANTGSQMTASLVSVCSSKKSAEMDSTGNNSITNILVSTNGFNIKIYPNPTTGLLTIETGENNANIGIYNIYGSMLKQQQLNGSVNQIDVRNLMQGTYIVKIFTSSGQQKVQLIIKK